MDVRSENFQNMTNAILSLLLTVFTSQFAFAQATYKAVDRAVQDGHMLRVTYVISQKVSKDSLLEFVKSTGLGSSANYPQEVAFFLFPGMIAGNGCWARADLKTKTVEIYGTTIEQEKELMARPIKADKILGKWIEDQGDGHLIALYSRGGKAYVGFLSPGDKAIRERELSRVEPRTEMRLKAVDGEDVYLITKDGNLEIHDSLGIVSAIPKKEIEQAVPPNGP